MSSSPGGHKRCLHQSFRPASHSFVSLFSNPPIRTSQLRKQKRSLASASLTITIGTQLTPFARNRLACLRLMPGNIHRGISWTIASVASRRSLCFCVFGSMHVESLRTIFKRLSLLSSQHWRRLDRIAMMPQDGEARQRQVSNA